MRASLASATSLIALLLLDGVDARATPSMTAGALAWPSVSADVMPGVPPPGLDWATAEGPGFATIATVSAFRFAGFAFTAGAEDAMSAVEPTADPGMGQYMGGGYAGGGSGAGGSVFIGNMGVVLADMSAGSASTTSASFGYTFSPTAGGGANSAEGRAIATAAADDTIPIEHAIFRGAGSGGAATGLGYTDLSRSVARLSANSDPGRSRSLADPGVTVTAGPSADGSPGTAQAAIKGGELPSAIAELLILPPSGRLGGPNSDDPDRNGSPMGANLSGADPESFDVAPPPAGSAVTGGGTLMLPMAIVSSGVGELPSNLTIFTSDTVGLDGADDTYSYFTEPEHLTSEDSASPSRWTLIAMRGAALGAVLGAALAGFASLRGRRRPRS